MKIGKAVWTCEPLCADESRTWGQNVHAEDFNRDTNWEKWHILHDTPTKVAEDLDRKLSVNFECFDKESVFPSWTFVPEGCGRRFVSAPLVFLRVHSHTRDAQGVCRRLHRAHMGYTPHAQGAPGTDTKGVLVQGFAPAVISRLFGRFCNMPFCFQLTKSIDWSVS